MLGGMLGTVTGSFAGGVASSDPAHGVVRATDFAVTQNGTPNMSVNVAAGGAFIRGTLNANQGAYHVWNDGTVNLSITAADATNGRRDLVIAQVRDAAYSGATNDARITVVTGTPAASPVDPSLASFPNALVLARITVAAGDTAINTADITDLRPLANQSGKMPVFTTQALATTAIPSPVDGQAYYLNSGTATEGTLWWHGSAYRPSWNMPWGRLANAVQGANTTTSGTTEQQIVTSASFTAVSNRYYQVQASLAAFGSVAGDKFYVRIREDSTSGTQLTYNMFTVPVANYYVPITLSYITGITAGSRTAVVTIQRDSGTGTASTSIFSSACTITVADVGASGAPV